MTVPPSDVLHYTACPLCGASKFETAFTCRDDLVSKETFTILRCTSCSFLFTQDVPQEKDIGRYYDTDAYIPHDITQRGCMHLVQRARTWVRLPGKRRLVEQASHLSTGHLLDIGCGSGEFPLMMQQKGWNVTATEQNAKMRAHCESQDISCLDAAVLAQLPSASFDAITLWHVLEHMHDLHGTIDQIHRLLKVGGSAIIAVPNIGGPLMRFYNIYDVPRHLWHFRPETLTRLAELHGFRVASIRPLYLDPLYMGLYYERLLKGPALRGALLGIIDVLYGLLRPRRAASLVYVLRSASLQTTVDHEAK